MRRAPENSRPEKRGHRSCAGPIALNRVKIYPHQSGCIENFHLTEIERYTARADQAGLARSAIANLPDKDDM
jgi:hypothetical protein